MLIRPMSAPTDEDRWGTNQMRQRVRPREHLRRGNAILTLIVAQHMDVKCTADPLLGKAADKFRLNLRGGWYTNLTEVTISGDHEVTFHLKRPQPSILALLASGYSPIYPCHVPPATLRTSPVGTGPFKLVPRVFQNAG
jgi:hypothetical protein